MKEGDSIAASLQESIWHTNTITNSHLSHNLRDRHNSITISYQRLHHCQASMIEAYYLPNIMAENTALKMIPTLTR